MVIIDGNNIMVRSASGEEQQFSIGTPEAFRLISQLWLRSGWDTKYVYSFTWLGRPIIQLPEDLIRLQEIIYQVQPDVIIEIGVAHGGSLVFSAGICRLIGKGRVIGIDIAIRSHNRKAIQDHQLSPLITLIEGDSIDAAVVNEVKSLIQPGQSVLVCLDGCHSRDHVYAELEAYGDLISSGSYIIAMDGIMKDLVGAPRSMPDWRTNNPAQAAQDFLKCHPEFQLEEPPFPFNEGMITERVTYWPHAFLRRT